jgi:hypothetical protein
VNPASERMLVHFASAHLSARLQEISQPLGDLAASVAKQLDSNNAIAGAEVTTGLRKLLEAKDCFVRAGVILHKEDVT